MNELLIQENPNLAHGFIDVSFENRDLSNDEFSDLPFRSANFSKSLLNNCRFLNNRFNLVEWHQNDANKVQLVGVGTENFVISYCKAIKMKMSNSKNKNLIIKNSEAHNCLFERSVFINSNFVDNEMYKANFNECIFINVGFTSNTNVEMYGMRSARFYKCTLINCRFTNINISESQLLDTILVKTTFDGITGDDITCSSVSVK